MTTRKPSSEKITKDEDQLQGPSSEEGKLAPSLPEAASVSDSDKSQQPVSQDTSVSDSEKPGDGKKKASCFYSLILRLINKNDYSIP